MQGVLWYVFLGSRGGDTRMRIVGLLRMHPANANQLKVALSLDYSTVRHSLRVLEKNRIIFAGEEKYGAVYRLSPEFMSIIEQYDALVACNGDPATCTRKRWEKILKERREDEGP